MVPTVVMTTTPTMTVMLAMMPIVRARTRIRTMMVPTTSTRNRNEDDDLEDDDRYHLTMLQSTDRITQVGPVRPRQHLGCAGVDSAQTESDSVTPGLRRVLRG